MAWVLLPGMDGTGELFRPFVAELPREDVAALVRYPREKALTRAELMRLIWEFLPVFEDYILVAESFSGQFGIEIAARQPARLRGLALVNTFAAAPVNRVVGALGILLADLVMRIRPPGWFVRRFLTGDDSSAEEVESARRVIGSVRGAALASRLRMILKCDAAGLLRHIKVPTLIVAGQRDRLVSRRMTEQMSASIVGAEVSWIDGPHLTLFTRPKEAIARMQRFWESAGGTSVEAESTEG